MRSCKLLFILMNFLVAKDVTYKIHTISTQDQQNLITLNGVIASDDDSHHNSRTTRDDTSTIWLQDFEGDLSDWTTEEGWELTEESSYSLHIVFILTMIIMILFQVWCHL